MKLLLPIIFILGATTSVWARKPSRLMSCLGAEEKLLHKHKDTGPVYDLNQRLIGELIQINQIEASKRLRKKLCGPGSSPSIDLLEEMVLNPKGWYQLPGNSKGLEANIAQELVLDFNTLVPEIFLNYLAQLQGLAPSPECLNRYVPGLKELNEQVKWLQEEEDLTVLTAQKSRMSKIFKSIKNIDKVFEKCKQDMNQSNVKSKNKDKGAGKPSAQ